MRIQTYLWLSLGLVFLSSCAILKEPDIVKKGTIDQYKYVFIPSTNDLSSGTGAIVGGDYGTYGSSVSKEVNPGSVIEGFFLKRGLITLDELNDENADNTLIVRYGESGKRVIAGGLGGYTLEVTIVILDAKSNNLVYSCTAEGQGSTEADDIREAIKRLSCPEIG